MRRRSPFWNLFFLLVLIVALIMARYYRGTSRRTLLVKYPILSPGHQVLGEASFWAEDHKDRILRIDLAQRPPEALYVILYASEGLGKQVGRIRGTVLIHSLGPSFSPNQISHIVLQGVKSGRIFGEVRISTPKE